MRPPLPTSLRSLRALPLAALLAPLAACATTAATAATGTTTAAAATQGSAAAEREHILWSVAGAEPVEDPELLARALRAPGQGGLTQGLAFRTTVARTVYRIVRRNAQNEPGAWWTLEPPTGTRDAYRAQFGICVEWNTLEVLERCTLEPGAHVIAGPGQSATCTGGPSYPVSPSIQWYVANRAPEDRARFTHCTFEDWQPAAQ